MDLHKLNLMFRSRYMDIYNKVKEDTEGFLVQPRIFGFKKRVAAVWYSYLKKHGVLRVNSHNRLPKRLGMDYYVPDPHAASPLKNGFLIREDLAERILFLGWP